MGHHLIELSKEIAKKHGKKKIILSTYVSNKPGLHLYKKFGFKMVGTHENYIYLVIESSDYELFFLVF